MRQTLARQREAKMKAMRAAEPQMPKEITVVAGDGKHVKIQLGGDQNEDSRKQVAEAAGLKHVPLPDFDDSANSAWAGSLKKTAKVKTMGGREGKISEIFIFLVLSLYFLSQRLRVTRVPGPDLSVASRTNLAGARNTRREMRTRALLPGWEPSDMSSTTTR